MLNHVGPVLAYLGASCPMQQLFVWATLALCWPILGHVARWYTFTPSNFLQITVFIVFTFFAHFQGPNHPSRLDRPLMAPYVGVRMFSVGPSLCWIILGMLRDAGNRLLAIPRKEHLFNVI